MKLFGNNSSLKCYFSHPKNQYLTLVFLNFKGAFKLRAQVYQIIPCMYRIAKMRKMKQIWWYGGYLCLLYKRLGHTSNRTIVPTIVTIVQFEHR